MVRPFRAETERYGHYSVAGEFVYDHPFQWGTKRTGPDLARVGGRYSDEWHRVAPRQSARRGAGVEHAGVSVARQDRGECRGHRGEDARAAHASACRTRTRTSPRRRAELKDKTEEDALVAYLQGLGLVMKNAR